MAEYEPDMLLGPPYLLVHKPALSILDGDAGAPPAPPPFSTCDPGHITSPRPHTR